MIYAAEKPESIAMPVILFVGIGAAVIYLFGYVRAVMHRANSDYKKTKALVPGLRKDFWRIWWRACKVGFWIAVFVAVLGFWAYGDITQDRPAPAATIAPSPSKGGQ
jgi:hypothetical protein